MARKKITTYKQKPKTPQLITLADGSKVMERYQNDKGSKPVYQKKIRDPEAGPKPKEDYKMKYPPPKKNKVFREKWKKFINSVTSRDNFIEAHLDTLAILCDCYVDYYALSETIRTEGRTYETVSRWGNTRKIHPAVGQINDLRKQIRDYTRQLDLFPKKDTRQGGEGEEEEWE